jgi:hypothetical protein
VPRVNSSNPPYFRFLPNSSAKRKLSFRNIIKKFLRSDAKVNYEKFRPYTIFW